jgi:hypothetical protein
VALLTPQQVVQLTGRKKPSLQIAWLEQQGLRKGVHFYVNAAGYPQVLDTLLPIKHLQEFELGEVR